jgi:hypothetical protein
MKGYKTIAAGLAMVILPPALQYLAGIDWSQLVGAKYSLVLSGLIMIGLRLVTTTPVGTKSAPPAAVILLGLLFFGTNQARAADVVPVDASGNAVVATAKVPCSPTLCYGFEIGGTFAGTVTSLNVIGQGISGSFAGGGQSLGVTADYKYFNGTFLFQPTLTAAYTVNGSPVIAGYSAPKYMLAALMKFGTPFSTFFPSAAPVSTTGFSSTLLASVLTPYLQVGLVVRPWGTGFASGAGIMGRIADQWTWDFSYVNVQYTGSNSVAPGQTLPQENLGMFTVSRIF